METIKNTSITEQLLNELKASKPKVKKEKVPKIVCSVDGVLQSFKDEAELKHFMFTQRVQNVIRYDLTGQVQFPIELVTVAVK